MVLGPSQAFRPTLRISLDLPEVVVPPLSYGEIVNAQGYAKTMETPIAELAAALIPV